MRIDRGWGLVLCGVLAACSGDSDDDANGDGSGGASGSATGGTGTAANGGSGSGGSSAGTGGKGAPIGGAGGAGGNGGPNGAGGSSGADGGVAGDGGGVTPNADGFYHMEQLDRGVVAVQVDDGVYVGWRMFGYEYDAEHADRIAYELSRDGEPIATITNSTNYLDADGTDAAKYSVRPVIDGAPLNESAEVGVWGENYLRIPLEVPPSATTPGSPQCETANESYSYSANDGSVGDVDGDGQYEVILKWDPSNAKDNSQSGCTGNVYIDAYTLSGMRLWRIDLGRNIRAGAHYTQFIVYDLDGDGKAEVTMKTAPGTRDGAGDYLAQGPAADDDDEADYRSVANASGRTGYVLSGPEYLTVFDGATGAERATVVFDQARETVNDWGDNYGNRVDRFLAGAAYLDDTGLPSVVMARGYYTRTTLTAWNFRGDALTQLWKFDSKETPEDADGHPFTGQGAHSLSVAEIDGDRGQEIIYGAMTIDHDGSGKCSTGYGHGDATHVGDLDPARPGLEMFMPHEDGTHPAYDLHDPNTCEILHEGPIDGKDTGRGAADDVFPGNPGAEFWAAGNTPLFAAASGDDVGAKPPSVNFLVWWDGDESREFEDGTAISKYGGDVLQSCDQCASNNTTKSTPTLSADLIGDWREEVIWREKDSSALRVYTTTLLTERRIYTLMHDPQYRVAIAWQNVAYNQPPHPSFHIGDGMEEPPRPDIRVR